MASRSAGSAVPPGNNPAPCDFQNGWYRFRDVADGLANPLTGLPNVVPWQEIPRLRVDGGRPQDPNDVNSDADGDGHADLFDNGPLDFNPGQEDANNDGEGDACEICHAGDPDGDGHCDDFLDDNGPGLYNPDQANNDRDLDGDLCDPDEDGDSILDDGDGSGTVGMVRATAGPRPGATTTASSSTTPRSWMSTSTGSATRAIRMTV